jgi:hypothetical protein
MTANKYITEESLCPQNKKQCLSEFVPPTETFGDFNRLQNVSDGVANPVTRQEALQGTLSEWDSAADDEAYADL